MSSVTSSPPFREDLGSNVTINEREARQILEGARSDFYRAAAELDAARARLLSTYRQVRPVIDGAHA